MLYPSRFLWMTNASWGPFIRQAFEVMADTPRHTYQILTKRSKRLETATDSLD